VDITTAITRRTVGSSPALFCKRAEMNKVPITLGIPTFGRGRRVFDVLEHVSVCDPLPDEIIVHVDNSNGQLERELEASFPSVRILSSTARVGPGGGRHRCIVAASHPLFVSLDDDSWPIDPEFFGEVVGLLSKNPTAAIVVASIYNRHEQQPERSNHTRIVSDYIGCGYAIRVDAYRQTTGHIDRYCPYAIEEVDIAMQLHALEWTIIESHSLRVFHDTELTHHAAAEIVSGIVQNVALCAFLRYPPILWPQGLLQVGNAVLAMIKRRRFAGLSRGLLYIPATLLRYRKDRRQLPLEKVRSYLRSRRTT
jgi:glycosyltransferase involved in cell wall biosynthesis